MSDNGSVNLEIKNGMGIISFYHPKGNSLPDGLLKELSGIFQKSSTDESIKVILLKSSGEGAFCGGASFDELLSIKNYETGKEFFMGFARLINTMRKCPQFIIARIHGKVVGGGVGLAAAADYTLAAKDAMVKLSELALGIGPFVVGPVIERKMGKAGFAAMSIDYDWHSAGWAKERGLFNEVYDNIDELDNAIADLTGRLIQSNPEAMRELKKIFWEGTKNWDKLLEERAEISGRLVLSEFTRKYIDSFKKK